MALRTPKEDGRARPVSIKNHNPDYLKGVISLF